jgi:hypothetical protein
MSAISHQAQELACALAGLFAKDTDRTRETR